MRLVIYKYSWSLMKDDQFIFCFFAESDFLSLLWWIRVKAHFPLACLFINHSKVFISVADFSTSKPTEITEASSANNFTSKGILSGRSRDIKTSFVLLQPQLKPIRNSDRSKKPFDRKVFWCFQGVEKGSCHTLSKALEISRNAFRISF